MNRLLIYVHFNKYNQISEHVRYQLKALAPLFQKTFMVSNSLLSQDLQSSLLQDKLVDRILLRENKGFDFAALRDAMKEIGFDDLKNYDSVTFMNDTCFGPIWDLESYYNRFEGDSSIDFWGMTNFRKNKEFREHIQSYFLSFSRNVVESNVFQEFWTSIVDYTDVQDVINHYETQVTTVLLDAGFNYGVVYDTVEEDTSGMLHPDFSYYNPTSILKNKVPFIKVKTIGYNTGISPYLFREIEESSDYPVELIVSHMSQIDFPDYPYLLTQKYLKEGHLSDLSDKKIAVHLHVFYTDLLQEFMEAFSCFPFAFDLYLTTDTEEKKAVIEEALASYSNFYQVKVTGNVGRDVLPMLKLKEELSQYDYVGHFHTKKSKEADFWAGESWRNELIDMLVKPAPQILSQFRSRKELGIVIADIPTFFRINRIVVAWNEHEIAPIMNELWNQMGLKKTIDFESMNTFVMSYGTYAWFKYDALKPLFDLNLTDQDVPAEPLPQNSILHAIERLLVYIAWDQDYDFLISKNPIDWTPFIDNKQLNNRGDLKPPTYVNFDYMGGIKGALNYLWLGPARAMKYIVKRLIVKGKS